MPTIPTPLTPGPVTGYDPRYGGVPSGPSPSAESLAAILANINNLAKLTSLSGGSGTASAEGARNQILASIPQFDALLGQFQKNVDAGSRGELNPDVLSQLNQRVAEYATGTGSLGPAAGSAALRAIGKTSYDVQQDALKNMATLTSLAPTGPAFDPASMMVDPNTQLLWQWLANQLGSAPIPASARADELNRQAIALREGLRQGGLQYGGNQYGQPKATAQDNSWLRDIINRGTGGGTVAPPQTTTGPGYGVFSSRTEDDWINEYLDQIAPLQYPTTETPPDLWDDQMGSDLDYLMGYSDDPGYIYDQNYNTGTINDVFSGSPFSPTPEPYSDYSPYQGYFENLWPSYDLYSDPFASAPVNDWSPEMEYAFPEWYE